MSILFILMLLLGLQLLLLVIDDFQLCIETETILFANEIEVSFGFLKNHLMTFVKRLVWKWVIMIIVVII